MADFTEHQRFMQNPILRWMMPLIIIADIVLVVALLQAFGNDLNKAGFFALLSAPLVAIGAILLTWWLYELQLILRVQEDGVRVELSFLARRTIPYDSIATANAVQYHPLREYGGWGVRFGKNGRAYNVSGDRGVRLQLHNDKHILLGSQHPEELAAAIRQHLSQT